MWANPHWLKKINEKLQGKIYSGKDYLRLEKNPSMAMEAFKDLLEKSVTGANVIYLITEKEDMNLLPAGAFRIVLTAQLDTIKARFRARMRGNLPQPLEKMLELKHGMYDTLGCDLKLNEEYNMEEIWSNFHL